MTWKRIRLRILAKAVTPRLPSTTERDELRDIIADATDEKPLQNYLARHPAFFTRLLPPGTGMAIYDRPKLGSEFIPDFLASMRNSQGPHWLGVELESPTVRALKKNGDMTGALGHAIGQVTDWRRWLRDNIAYARTELRLAGISGDVKVWIVMGRRTDMNAKQAARYESLQQLGIEILSYDRLLDT